MADEPKDEQDVGQNPERQAASTGEQKARPPSRITIFVILVLAALFALFLIIPNVLGDSHRPVVNRYRADMRTLATGIEAYFIDNHSYPAWASGMLGVNSHMPTDSPSYTVPTFRIKQGPDDQLMTLTTPISYVTAYFPDTFASDRGDATFAYWVPPSGKGWILWGTGPDGVYDINPQKDYDPSQKAPSISLLNNTYDPTNGTKSRGDVWRLKQ